MKERFRSYVWRCANCLKEQDKAPPRGHCPECKNWLMYKMVPITLANVMKAVGIPEPMCEYVFAPEERQWRFDWSWSEFRPHRALKIAVEIDGGAWTKGRHVRGKGFIEDMAKQNAAVIRGWAILRFTPEQITSGAFLDVLKRAWEAA